MSGAAGNELFGASPGDAVFDQMVDLRRAVHRRPELAFEERSTTALIRDHMASLGIDELLRVTETGGIFAMDGGRPGRTVVLRGDIDALPVQEPSTKRSWVSEVEGLMHACGHDVHVGSVLGAASVLASRREDVPGRYIFLFQPGEEALCGGKAMVEGGALSVMEGARLVGFHVTSVIPTGMVAVRAGITMSEAHSLRITLRGPGGHGAVPTATGDVIRATAALVGRLGSVVEGLSYEGTDCVCSAGTLRAGTAVNVVPTSAVVTGTLRTFTDPQRVDAVGRLERLCAEIAAEQGVSVDLELPEHTPAVVNDPAAVDLVEAEAKVVLGDPAVLRMPPASPSDDVSEFLNRLPGCYFFVGGAAADGSSGMHHSPSFYVEDESLRVGASVLVRGALALASA
ncbi:MAG TPA: M20 family metallopeptidase [Acidimicrobiales bacterium]|nr:M20 family metallopeptidase [Acidimicrobiales bacterium]